MNSTLKCNKFPSPGLLDFAILCLLIGASIGLLGPFQIYSNNQTEFGLGAFSLLPFTMGFAVTACALLIFPAAMILKRFRPLLFSLLFGLSVSIFVQGNFLAWSYGSFNGERIAWQAHSGERLIEYGVWGFILLASLLLRKLLVRERRTAMVVLLLFILGNLCAAALSSPLKPREEKDSNLAAESLYQLSSGSNIIVILLDAFQSGLFARVLEQEPELARTSLKDFTWYRNALGAYRTTTASIPAILTGKLFRNESPFSAFLAAELPEHSIPAVLKSQGYTAQIASLPQLCQYLPAGSCTYLQHMVSREPFSLKLRESAFLLDSVLFRYLPQAGKKAVYAGDNWLLQQFVSSSRTRGLPRTHANSLEFVNLFEKRAEVATDKPTFLFLHFFVPHVPMILSEDCQLIPKKERKKGQPQKVGHARCGLRLAERIIETTKRLGVYERSSIMVIADHGSPFAAKNPDNTERFPFGYASPLIMIKPAGSSSEAMTTSEAPAALTDLPKTISEMAGVKNDFPGENIMSIAEDAQRTRTYLHYHWEHRYWTMDSLPPLTEYQITSSNPRDLNGWKLAGKVAGRDGAN